VLHEALAGQRAQLADTTTASDPELVVVFDLAGTVDQFMRACAKVITPAAASIRFPTARRDRASSDHGSPSATRIGRIDDVLAPTYRRECAARQTTGHE